MWTWELLKAINQEHDANGIRFPEQESVLNTTDEIPKLVEEE